MKRKIELLAPAGNLESVYAAVNGGADAVYMGAKAFSARQYADNFSDDDMKTAIDYCHLRGVKVYIAINTLYKDSEINEVLNLAREAYEIGADAFIMQDMGSAMLIKEYLPDMPLFASTQMTASSLEDVKKLKESGFSRVILSRELSFDEVKHISENAGVDTEVFIHGALCVSYSGQCIMSSMLGGRSGNRGRCAQPCRMPYTLVEKGRPLKEGYLLSPKDIETLPLIPSLIESGVCSFKIEGRMKSAEYVAGVTMIYRKYIDKYLNGEKALPDEKDINILLQLFNRGGFTDGYLKTHSGISMMSFERPKPWGLLSGFADNYDTKHKRVTIRTKEGFVPGDGIEIWTKNGQNVGCGISKPSKAGEYINIAIDGDVTKNDLVYKTFDKELNDSLGRLINSDVRKIDVSARFKGAIGKASEFELEFGDIKVKVSGDPLEKAQNNPMTNEKIKAQLIKMGSTPFKISNIEVLTDDNSYINIKSLNDMRRRSCDELAEKILENSRRSTKPFPLYVGKEKPAVRNKRLTVSVSTLEQLKTVLKFGEAERVYIEVNDEFAKNLDYIKEASKKHSGRLFLAFPRVYRGYAKAVYSEFIKSISPYIDGFLIRSAGEVYIANDLKKPFVIDFSLNVLNNETLKFWHNEGALAVTLSPELNLSEIRTAGEKYSEILGYGYMPLMVTHQCPIGNFAGGKTNVMFCSKKGNSAGYTLKDKKSESFYIKTDCKTCTCEILNGKPLFLLKFFDEIADSPSGFLRLSFTIESGEKTEEMLEAYASICEAPDEIDVKTDILIKSMEGNKSTKGHYFRGVE
ncbi:MAG: DUF3656 domain-containing protein [Lachnospiraceae bacterium]|nr:DUF3656 domain-containing protein [Lachnospiraceae bacterium]